MLLDEVDSLSDFEDPSPELKTVTWELCASWGTLSTKHKAGEGQDWVTLWSMKYLLAVLVALGLQTNEQQLKFLNWNDEPPDGSTSSTLMLHSIRTEQINSVC